MTRTPSTLDELLADCDAHAIRLALAGCGGLEIDAPSDALTPDLLARLKAHKGDLLAFLARRDTAAEGRSKNVSNWSRFGRENRTNWSRFGRVAHPRKRAERPAHAASAIDDATWDFMPVTSVATPWCPVYHHPRMWRSIYGDHLICATCHPPATPEIVAEYLTFEQAMP